MYHQTSVLIYDHLSRVRESLVGGTSFTLAGLTVDIQGKDSIGNLIQEWLGVWLIQNGYNIAAGDASQDYPDFHVGEERALLEVKAFNCERSPAFDIANFEAYCESLVESPFRLYSDYLIFSYRITGHHLSIENIWLKKIWEITGRASDFPLKCQVKYRARNTQNQTYSIDNIRPIVWHSTRNGVAQPFNDSRLFTNALYETQLMYRGYSNLEAFETNLNLWQRNTRV